jgi:hypothetical protein
VIDCAIQPQQRRELLGLGGTVKLALQLLRRYRGPILRCSRHGMLPKKPLWLNLRYVSIPSCRVDPGVAAAPRSLRGPPHSQSLRQLVDNLLPPKQRRQLLRTIGGCVILSFQVIGFPAELVQHFPRYRRPILFWFAHAALPVGILPQSSGCFNTLVPPASARACGAMAHRR